MRIDTLLNANKRMLSFEVFPPKPNTDVEPIRQAIDSIADMKPSFMSVTYGAGGGNSKNTVEIAKGIARKGVTPLAHLTCIGATKDDIRKRLSELREAGIENVLALRGDRPKDMPSDIEGEYPYADALVRDIRDFGGFCIGAACYPEGHVECRDRAQDLSNLKRKVESGCDFLTTQMFFDNSVLYSFLYRLRDNGIQIPVVPGVMPVTNSRQIARSCELSGTSLPSRFRMIVDKFGDDPAAMKQAGIAYATEQIIDLFANGISAVHLYTMNKPDVAAAILSNLSEILK
ncbi:MAG: methylenetetrahydrofolate reductase [NAD(P)H] [Ruminococcaceae bacterium]|nr:methylenetetrahydrofolate reductase [NAD(P)H] [Oscillospiraceae bacterium]